MGYSGAMPSTALAETIRTVSIPSRPRWPDGPEAFLQGNELGADGLRSPRKTRSQIRNVWSPGHKRKRSGSKKGRSNRRKERKRSPEQEQRELEARLAAHSAKFEPLRAKIVKLLVEYGWQIDPSPKDRLYGILHIQKEGFILFVETSGFQRLYEQLLRFPEAWGYVDWIDPAHGPLPLPYHLTQCIEESNMALSNQDKIDIRAMIAEGVAEALKDYSMPSTRISFSLSQKIGFASFFWHPWRL